MAKHIDIEILTPTCCLYSGQVNSLQIPLHDGLAGVLPGHGASLGLLGYGLLRLRDNKANPSFVIDGGFVEITPKHVKVIANHGEPLASVDRNQAMRDFKNAQQAKARGDDEIQKRLDQLQAARVRLQHTSKS